MSWFKCAGWEESLWVKAVSVWALYTNNVFPGSSPLSILLLESVGWWMAYLSFNIWPGRVAMSVRITPQRRKKINARRVGGDGQQGCRVNRGNETERLRASERNTKEISQMILGCSSNKNALTTCTINGTVSQESTGPLECTVKVSGSLKHHWTALELKQGGTSTLWVSWENASQFLLIILKLSQVKKQNKKNI